MASAPFFIDLSLVYKAAYLIPSFALHRFKTCNLFSVARCTLFFNLGLDDA